MARKSKAAYRLVDLSELSDEQRRDVIEDAMMGAGEYGVREVEVVHNGPARQSIYGVYFGPDEAKWETALKEFGEEPEELSEEEQEAREEVLRGRQQEIAAAEAERVREAEEREVRRIAGDDAAGNKAPDEQARAEAKARDKAEKDKASTNKAKDAK